MTAVPRPPRPADDNYPTPPEATRALLSVESFRGSIWEPCAGAGAMSDVLRSLGYQVHATTLGDSDGAVQCGVDFLAQQQLRADNIVSNLPFKLAEEMALHAIGLKPAKLALLLNIKFLAGRARRKGIFAEHPPARVWVFSDRVTMYPGGYDGPKNTTTETMAWFVWDWPFPVCAPAIGWIDSAEHRVAA